MTPVLVIAVIGAAGIAACLGTRALIPVLRRASVLDRPNERSSHAIPTPRGGGIAVIAASLAAWLVLIAAGAAPATLLAVIAGAAALAAISWLDDLRGLSPAVRLGAQCAAVALGIFAAMPEGAVFQGWLPPRARQGGGGAALGLVRQSLQFHGRHRRDRRQRDGGDRYRAGAVRRLPASDTIRRSPPRLPPQSPPPRSGFLVWNWAPARIFLGDVGSVPLGYLLGFLLLATASRGHWKIALILPLYFLADATITLLRRLLRGERVWLPHREHFYQQAVRRGLGHAAVVRRVIAADVDPDRVRPGSPRPSRARSASRSRRQPCSCCWRALPEGTAAPIPRPVRLEGGPS